MNYYKLVRRLGNVLLAAVLAVGLLALVITVDRGLADLQNAILMIDPGVLVIDYPEAAECVTMGELYRSGDHFILWGACK